MPNHSLFTSYLDYQLIAPTTKDLVILTLGMDYPMFVFGYQQNFTN